MSQACVWLAAGRQFGTYSLDVAALPASDKVVYEREARLFAEEQRGLSERQQKAILVELRILAEAEQTARRERGATNHVTSVRLTQTDLEFACDVYNSVDTQSIRLEPHLGAFGEGPRAPGVEEQRLIKAVVGDMMIEPQEQGDTPWCARELCRSRTQVHGMAVGFDRDSPLFWIILFAKASPHECSLLELRLRGPCLELTQLDVMS